MLNPQITYAYTRGERGISAEIYFPKKVVYQSAIFDALRDGHKPKFVKDYLNRMRRHFLKNSKTTRTSLILISTGIRVNSKDSPQLRKQNCESSNMSPASKAGLCLK